MKTRTIFLSILTLLTSSIVDASNAGWRNGSTIKKIVVTSNGGINVELEPALSGCVSQSGYGEKYASIYPSHPGIDKIHANLLAAAVSKQKVDFYFSDDSCKVLEIRHNF